MVDKQKDSNELKTDEVVDEKSKQQNVPTIEVSIVDDKQIDGNENVEKQNEKNNDEKPNDNNQQNESDSKDNNDIKNDKCENDEQNFIHKNSSDHSSPINNNVISDVIKNDDSSNDSFIKDENHVQSSEISETIEQSDKESNELKEDKINLSSNSDCKMTNDQVDQVSIDVSTKDKDSNKVTDTSDKTTIDQQDDLSTTDLNNELNDELSAKLEDVDLNSNSDVELEESPMVAESVCESVVESMAESAVESVSESDDKPIIIQSNDEQITNEINPMLSNDDEEDDKQTATESNQELNSQQETESDQDDKTEDDSQPQPTNSFKVTNLDHLLSATLTDNSLTDEIKLNVLCSKIVALSADDNIDVQPFADSILKLLIKEDMQKINSPECMQIFFSNYIRHLPKKLLAEILSMLIAVFKKSLLNVELSKGILLDCLSMYVDESQKNTNDNLIKHFLKEIIGQLCNYSCNVKELKNLIKISEDDPQLLALIRQANLHQRGRPNSFFNFSGTKGSVLSLPPLTKMPTQNGWTFICWFRIEPNTINSQPYLYYLRSSKSNVGYSAHFTGNCLVLTSMKVKGKGFQHCIPYEFSPFKWYHCVITYIAKWRTSEIKVYVNGQLTANNEMAWQVQTADIYDKCFIGGTSEIMNEAHLFCGQLSAIYMFDQSLSASQICAIHRLGPNYMGQYKYANEMFYFDTMPSVMKKVLYEEKLSSALFSLYTPVAIESDTLCLQSAPKSNLSYFTSSGHAALLGDAKAITNYSISYTLQSIGGIRALLPLLNKFSGSNSTNTIDTEACSTIIGFICDLLESSHHWFGNEVVQSSSFVIISTFLMKNAKVLINEKTLDIILNLTKTLISASVNAGNSDDSVLLKQLMDSILFNSSLWIYVNSKLQIRLYSYLATEFLSTGVASSAPLNQQINSSSNQSNLESNSNNYSNASSTGSNLSNNTTNNSSQQLNGIVFSEVRRISTVLQLLHSLKYYYWVVPEDQPNQSTMNVNYELMNALKGQTLTNSIQPIQVRARDNQLRPCKNDLITIRGYILLFIKQLIIKGNGVHHDELQAILNYLTTVFQDENLIDVMQMLQSLMIDHSASMIPAFDQKQGIKTIFKLLESENEQIRIQALKLLGYFLSRSVLKRKLDVMQPHNLFMLLCERLMKFSPLTIETYNALFEILVETPIESVRSSGASALSSLKIENSMILKVIATIIIEGNRNHSTKPTAHKYDHLIDKKDKDQIKKLFINDLWKLLVNNRENRRLVLQMSVWQNWLINLIDKNDQIIRDQILTIFRVLLYHAIKFEFGGWRVWIDTLAILHSKFSEIEHDEMIEKMKAVNTISNTVLTHKIENNNGINHQFNEKINKLTNESQSVDELDKDDDNNTQSSNIKIVSSESQICTISSSDVDRTNSEQEGTKEPSISTITSLNESENEISQDKKEIISQEDENGEEANQEINKDDTTDVAATRIFRKNQNPNTKDFYSNLLLSGQQTKLNNNSNTQERKFSGIPSTTPAFRIPEFRWSHLHLKLLNDLLYSIECDIQCWKSQGTKDISKEFDDTAKVISASHLDQILQNPDNQIYVVNSIHLISQLCDNIIIASGGLLPLLASATGGNSSNNNSANHNSINRGGEGLTSAQANSLLYRLVNLADILCFAATHINFAELENEKNMSPGGILEQCLRLVCTVAVKNCLIVQKHQEENGSDDILTLESINQNNIHNLGIPLTSAAELFGGDYGNFSGANTVATCSGDEDSSSIDSAEIHHTGNTPSDVMINHLSMHPSPIKDLSKLLQEMDVNRLRACIYRDADADAKQSQFLALATLYFISVLMVSKYRDIIEPKFDNQSRNFEGILENELNGVESQEFRNKIGVDPANIGDILTSKLETTLSNVCPILKEIMCDFAGFLSKKLVGSHGQDLVSKEIVRTFKRSNVSSVELVMLLCSQEWQNTLQKNAGLGFIELINRGRILSHSMKDHIVRVAMEAEFILNRLRADDVTKHEEFNISCLETMQARYHEESLINSLITSAKRRDRMLYTRFKENLLHLTNVESLESLNLAYKLDQWEDDSRRKRRFVLNPYSSLDNCGNRLNVNRNQEESISKEKELKEQQKNLSTPIYLPQNSANKVTSSCKDNNSLSNEEDMELFSWEPDDINSSTLELEDDRERANNAEFVETVLFTVNCSLIWCTYAVEGQLQITSNEMIFEANNISFDSSSCCALDGAIMSKSSKGSKSRPSSASNQSAKMGESLKNLVGSNGSRPAKGTFKDLDLNVLRYCDLLNYNGKIQFSEIRAIFSRRYLLQPNALEIFLSHRTSVMFTFADFETVKKVIKYLPPVGVGVKYGIVQSRRASLMSPKQLFAASNMTQKWQKREITNFEYLMFLNTCSGRTYNDLNQYFVFPWILTNYESEELDLTQPANFRDLSKPVGALNSERRNEFIERYNNWDTSCLIPPFFYGTHYSTAAFTLSWLIRLEPFYSAYLALQDGQMEEETRLFTSISDSWIGSLMGGQQNVKELTPEWFYLPEMLTGTEATPLLENVKLPKWAKSPQHFIRLHRMALESDLVSCQLHQWIDLIWGYKAKGVEAVKATNVFYYLTYEGNVDLSVTDPCLREAIEAQIRHFGITPSQLTTDCHPPRNSALHISPLIYNTVLDEVNQILKFPFNASITHIAACSMHNSAVANNSNLPSTIVTINSNLGYHLHKWNPKESSQQPFSTDPCLSSSSSTSSLSSSNASSNVGTKRQLQDLSGLCTADTPQYIVTLDAKHIIIAPFFDNSFRVYSTIDGKITQIVYGHRGLITCIVRSECNVVADFYIASGSKDCSILLWTWNAKYSQIEGNNNMCSNNNSQIVNPLPKLTLTGHESEIKSLLISAELGLIVSGSLNLILIHTTTNGDIVCYIDIRNRFKKNLFCARPTKQMDSNTYFKNTKEASIEASLIGPSSGNKNLAAKIYPDSNENDSTVDLESQAQKAILSASKIDPEDYFITNLVLSRELAFIVGIAIPKKSLTKLKKQTSSTLLFTYNLRGQLMKCVSFSTNSSFNPLLTTTRDGEYLIIVENHHTVKIIQSFDLTPLYALSISDLNLSSSLQNNDESNSKMVNGSKAIRSILLLDYKYLLVGLDSGKLIIYNIDFNKWHHEFSSSR